jgi:uncharacterized iron-regulated protein
MRPALSVCAVVTLAGCSGQSGGVAPMTFALPDSAVVVDGRSGAGLATPELLRRMHAADVVLLGEVHDNAFGHALRGALLQALAQRRPAVVFEQFAASPQPLPPPAPGDSLETWLDGHGFDRAGWRWPLHRPVVAAAVAHARSLWGSGIARPELRAVVQQGAAGAPPELRALMERVPLDSAAQATLDRQLVEGHCGQLPESQRPGMRAAQVVRDASMARALLAALATGPAWLVAGNGHVRNDVAVPRLLRVLAADARVVSVGVLERTVSGADPDAAERGAYDIVIITPRAPREDPCRRFAAPR